MRNFMVSVVVAGLVAGGMVRGEERVGEVNSVGMRMVRVEGGVFEMGVDSVPLGEALTKGVSGVSWDRPDGEGDYDEVPVHRVRITGPVWVGEEEVTVEQFRRFRPGYKPNPQWGAYAAGVSWDEAVGFCEWLSKKEGKTYRLPTEAEWEFVCRAGTRTPFAGGDKPDGLGVANAWGVKNMQAGVAEWCWDWWGRYTAGEQVDPVGPAVGTAKVVRGGGLDWRKNPKVDGGRVLPAELPYWRRSANRACVAKGFSTPEGHIGFRVVRGEMPKTQPAEIDRNFFMVGVKQNRPDLKVGPEMGRAYYRQRPMFPDLGGRDMRAVGWKVGIPSGMGAAYHNSAVQMCDNGDLIAAYYNTLKWEDDIEQSVLTMRLRYGSEEWDMPEPWPDFVDGADAAPIFWNDGGKMWMFFGSPRVGGAPPFWFMTSTDNGASWTEARVPVMEGKVGGYTPQPVNSVVRTGEGKFFVAVDGEGADTVLFATEDDGKTWRDTGGRTGGRHTSFVLGKDGSIIGYGGKNSNVEGFMPVSVSRDGGRTYEVSKTEFMPLAGGQRPSVIRLASGRLFFVADTLSSRVPGGRTASYVAISEDEGKTWRRRILPINSTCGYVTATQTPNGVIHIVTSKTKPVLLHVEMNEEWVMKGGEARASVKESSEFLVPSSELKRGDEAAGREETAVTEVKGEKEFYPSGKLRAEWSGGVAAGSGGYLLEGRQVIYFENGGKEWESTYAAGKRVGTETLWGIDGGKRWEREFKGDGTWVWRVYDEGGGVKAESVWRGKLLIEPGAPR